MYRVVRVAVLLAAGFFGCCAARAQDAAPLASIMPNTTVPAPTPAGFVNFCMRFPSQCQNSPKSPGVVQLTDATWHSLDRINRDVNAAIWPEEDQKHYGRQEYWTIPTDGYGDCDDYAVTKRKELIDAGFPAQALRLAVVISPRAGRHAVLTVVTDKGDLVLDNLRNDIVSWNATDFFWVERQDSSNPLKWVSLMSVAQLDQAVATGAVVSGH